MSDVLITASWMVNVTALMIWRYVSIRMNRIAKIMFTTSTSSTNCWRENQSWGRENRVNGAMKSTHYIYGISTVIIHVSNDINAITFNTNMYSVEWMFYGWMELDVWLLFIALCTPRAYLNGCFNSSLGNTLKGSVDWHAYNQFETLSNPNAC